jgi:hypothetical protein
LKTIADPPERDRWARLRFSIIGPLLAAPAAPKQLGAAFLALAAKTWRHPVTGLDVRFGASTLERWYYAARRAADPVAALRDRPRADEGCFPSLTPVAIAALTRQYREHPGWTAQLHLDNLRVACKDSGTPVASYTTLRRYLRAQGMHRQANPKRATEGAVAARDRLEQLEVRSFEVEHVAALWRMRSPAVCGVRRRPANEADAPALTRWAYSGRPEHRDQSVGRLESPGPQCRGNGRSQSVELLGGVDAQIHLGGLNVGMAQPQRHLAQIAGGLQDHQGTAVPPMSPTR